MHRWCCQGRSFPFFLLLLFCFTVKKLIGKVEKLEMFKMNILQLLFLAKEKTKQLFYCFIL